MSDSSPKTKTVCVVGSSPNVLQEELGEKIDSCDIVIRMNVFKVAGFEKHVGSKTDIAAFTFRPGRMEYMFKESGVMKIDGVKFWSTQPFNSKINPSGPRRQQEAKSKTKRDDTKPPSDAVWTGLIDKIYQDYWRKSPSSGLITLEMAREEWSDAEIYFCGFDDTTDKAHYCSDHVDYSTPQNPAGHHWLGEYNYIRQLVRDGKIKHIRDKDES